MKLFNSGGYPKPAPLYFTTFGKIGNYEEYVCDAKAVWEEIKANIPPGSGNHKIIVRTTHTDVEYRVGEPPGSYGVIYYLNRSTDTLLVVSKNNIKILYDNVLPHTIKEIISKHPRT